jgi:hypothetical protein
MPAFAGILAGHVPHAALIRRNFPAVAGLDLAAVAALPVVAVQRSVLLFAHCDFSFIRK